LISPITINKIGHLSNGEVGIIIISMVIVILCGIYIINDDRHWW